MADTPTGDRTQLRVEVEQALATGGTFPATLVMQLLNALDAAEEMAIMRESARRYDALEQAATGMTLDVDGWTIRGQWEYGANNPDGAGRATLRNICDAILTE